MPDGISDTQRAEWVQNKEVLNNASWWIQNVQALREHEGLQHFTFVQVGSYGPDLDLVYDYVTTDPKWRGLIVEASPLNIRLLHHHYQKEIEQGRLVVENRAVTDACPKELVKFYIPKNQDHLPENMSWLRGIGQLASPRVLQDPEGWCFHTVQCAQLGDVVAKSLPEADGWINDHGVDLVQLDAESFEYPILKGFDINKYRPCLVRFEEIEEGKKNKASLYQLLEDANYVIFPGSDSLAVRKDIAKTFLGVHADMVMTRQEVGIAHLPEKLISDDVSQLLEQKTEQCHS